MIILNSFTPTKTYRLNVCECDFGGNSVFAYLYFNGGKIGCIGYFGEAGSYPWSQTYGWADACKGMTETEMRRWAADFFSGFKQGKSPYIAIDTISNQPTN